MKNKNIKLFWYTFPDENHECLVVQIDFGKNAIATNAINQVNIIFNPEVLQDKFLDSTNCKNWKNEVEEKVKELIISEQILDLLIKNNDELIQKAFKERKVAEIKAFHKDFKDFRNL